MLKKGREVTADNCVKGITPRKVFAEYLRDAQKSFQQPLR
jgi:hypothetical protein